MLHTKSEAPSPSLTILSLSFEQNVLQDIAETEDTYKSILVVHNSQPVDTRLLDCVKDGVQAVVYGTCKDSWEVLGSLLKSFPDGQVEIIIAAGLDERDDVDCFEHIDDNVCRCQRQVCAREGFDLLSLLTMGTLEMELLTS